MKLKPKVLDLILLSYYPLTAKEAVNAGVHFWISLEYETNHIRWRGIPVIKTPLLSGEEIAFGTEIQFLNHYL